MTTNLILSETGICNMALTRMGSSQQITSLSDGSNEANQCLIWYPQNRDAMLADFPLTEAYAQLVEVAGPETTQQRANSVWSRSYRYPADCLTMQRIVRTPALLSATIPQTTGPQAYPYMNEAWRRAVGDATPISYSLSSDADGRLIVTDAADLNGLTAVYTKQNGDPTQFSPVFADALAWRLAADLAMALGRDDAKRQYCQRMYELTKGSSRASQMNQTQSDIPHVWSQSQTVRARWRR